MSAGRPAEGAGGRWPGGGPIGAAWRRVERGASNLAGSGHGLELVVLAVWALVIAGRYLDLDPNMVPTGREYPSAVQPYFAWVRARECGLCGFWNGSVLGGVPALVDLHAGVLHPLAVVPILLLGMPSGAKVALFGAFVLAGFAQWWLARVLGLGAVARVWSAAMAIAAGHMAGRMEAGWINVVIATAACALVLPPLVSVGLTGARRAVAWLGATLAMAAVAGQGYLQIGLLFTAPAALLLVPREDVARIARRYGLALVLAVLLAAPLVVPFLHFWPQFGKDMDTAFQTSQPARYLALNLVIDDTEYFSTEALGRVPVPGLYTNFVGWIPVLLAFWALRGHRDDRERRVVAYLAAVVVLALWLAGAGPLRWLVEHVSIPWARQQVAGIRNPALVAGLAVPPLLALSAIAVDRLARAPWPELDLALRLDRGGRQRRFAADLRWLLAVPLVVALVQAGTFARHWVGVLPVSEAVTVELEALRTPDLQWVAAPYGEHPFIEPAVRMGLKIVDDLRPAYWRDRPAPEPYLQASRSWAPEGMVSLESVAGVTIYRGPPDREYAVVTHGSGLHACSALGTGGDIDVRCDVPEAGILTVKENRWSGWQVQVDGQPAKLRPGRWLAVDLPAGAHVVQLRYRPWDVPLGLVLSVLGLIATGLVWRSGRGEADEPCAPIALGSRSGTPTGAHG